MPPVSARGMDYDNVSLVIQFGVAPDREIFIHRTGRTARAGKEGRGLVILGEQEEPFLHLLKVRIAICAIWRLTAVSSFPVGSQGNAPRGISKGRTRQIRD